MENQKTKGEYKMEEKETKKLNRRNYFNSISYYNSTKLLPQWSKVRVCNVNK